MGQKVNPTGIRLGIVKDHASVWYAERGAYADKLNNDLEVRSFLDERLKSASVSRIHIERPANNARITIHTARPGIVIGKKGEDVDRLRRDLNPVGMRPTDRIVGFQDRSHPGLGQLVILEWRNAKMRGDLRAAGHHISGGSRLSGRSAFQTLHRSRF